MGEEEKERERKKGGRGKKREEKEEEKEEEGEKESGSAPNEAYSIIMHQLKNPPTQHRVPSLTAQWLRCIESPNAF